MKSTIVFGIMRGGSSIAFDIVHRLLGCAGVRYDDFIGRAYDTGISLDHLPSDLHSFAPCDQLYGPFRECPDWLFQNGRRLASDKNIGHSRSQGLLGLAPFHFEKTHSSFQSTTVASSDFDIQRASHYSNIDVHVLVWSRYFRLRFEKYLALCQIDPKLHVYRYEDMAADFNGWIDDLVEVLRLPTTDPVMEEVDLIKATVTLEKVSEDPLAHHRLGKPGGFVDQLCGEAVDELTHYFSDTLKFFGYDNLSARRHFRRTGAGTAAVTRENTESEVIRRQLDIFSRENGSRIAEIAALRESLAELRALAQK